MEKKIEIYQSIDKTIQLEVKLEQETVWLNRQQISELFNRDVKTIGKHINNVFKDKELNKESVIANFATTASDGKTYQVQYYNLDVIISVGYRVKSKEGVQFRQWATKRLKDYLIQGYAINQKVLEQNKKQFLKTLEDLKLLSQNNDLIETTAILSLIESFSATFFALENFDNNNFPKQNNEAQILSTAQELKQDLEILKQELIKKGEATDLFSQEKKQGNLQGIYGNVFQSVFGQDAYPSVEEKAAHLLYFIVKNHPFNDGNKRSGAFAFIWLLQKANYNFTEKITPETLTTLTILIAISNPSEKEKMVGLILLLLNTAR